MLKSFIMERPLLFGYYLTHRALRKDVERLKFVTGRFAAYNQRDWKKVMQWFSYHAQMVHHHHEGEDTFFFPIIRQRAPGFAPELQQMDDEHKALDRFEEKLSMMLNSLGNSTQIAAADFNNLALAYGRLVISHLDAEENVVGRAINQEFKREEVIEAEDRYTRMMPPERLRLSLPWLADVMTKEERNMFFSVLPFYVKWIYLWRLKPQFDRMVKCVGS